MAYINLLWDGLISPKRYQTNVCECECVRVFMLRNFCSPFRFSWRFDFIFLFTYRRLSSAIIYIMLSIDRMLWNDVAHVRAYVSMCVWVCLIVKMFWYFIACIIIVIIITVKRFTNNIWHFVLSISYPYFSLSLYFRFHFGYRLDHFLW